MHPQAEGEWMGWRGWRGRKEVSSLKTQENPQHEHEWKGNEMTATEPTDPFSGAKCWCACFFCCWFDVWRMDGKDINCVYFLL